MVTYAKVGTVLAADVNPFKNEELDSQGRCVMTDHGKFVLFNVYVPNGGGNSEGFVNKMKFLNALRKAMAEQRKEGKAVMLVGDMNAKIDKKDIFWRHRCLNVDEVLKERNNELPKWKADIKCHWSVISDVLKTIEVSIVAFFLLTLSKKMIILLFICLTFMIGDTNSIYKSTNQTNI